MEWFLGFDREMKVDRMRRGGVGVGAPSTTIAVPDGGKTLILESALPIFEKEDTLRDW